MLPALAALVHLQKIDSAADAARKRLSELPAAEAAASEHVAGAEAVVTGVKEKLAANHAARRALEKDVAAVDARLTRFDDHKAAVKTNQEYTALLHEIATARGEKDAIEERILLLMEEADGLAGELKEAEDAVAAARRQAEELKRQLAAEAGTLERDLDRLSAERAGPSAEVDGHALALYEQLRKQRRGLAVAPAEGEICSACHVRLRPHVTQKIRRGEGLVQCESCQRILFFEASSADSGAA